MKKVLLIFALLFLCEACSVLTIVKDCSKVSDDSNRFVCRTVKPLE